MVHPGTIRVPWKKIEIETREQTENPGWRKGEDEEDGSVLRGGAQP